MFASKKYHNKKIAIYGMGLTGCSVAKTFKKLKAKIFWWDDDKEVRKKIEYLNFPINKFWLNQDFSKMNVKNQHFQSWCFLILNHSLQHP